MMREPKLYRPEVILLDLDNTVYPYNPCHEAGLVAAEKVAAGVDERWADRDGFRADYRAARREVKDRIKDTGAAHCRLLYFKVMTERVLGRTDVAVARRLHDAYWDGYFAALRVDEGCADLLRTWRAAGVRTAWVSDFTTERQMLKLLRLGLADAVEFLITAEETGAVKPHAGGIDLALERLGAATTGKHAWFIGDDHDRDLGAARARGLTAVWFRRDPDARPSTEPDATVSSWAELAVLWHDAEG